jgi:hypothetical protein
MFVKAVFNVYASSYIEKVYEYIVPEGMSPKVGDYIVTSFKEGYGRVTDQFKIAKITEILDHSASATRSFLTIITNEEIVSGTAVNTMRQETIKAKTAAKKRLDQLVSERLSTNAYKELIASGCEEAEGLLKILEA